MTQISEKPAFKSGYVALVGKPNVGKSTLLNNLLNFKISVVTRKPQTTRRQIKGILNSDNYQIIFLDTPGLLEPKYKLQEAMLAAANRALQEADVTVLLLEAPKKLDKTDWNRLAELSKTSKNLIVALNKVDLIDKNSLLPLIEQLSKSPGVQLRSIVPISALKSNGLDLLVEEIVGVLPVGFPFYSKDQITDHPERFLVGELIREQILLRFGDEIPYSTTVEIDEFSERRPKDFIRAIIYVERKSQKGILIGKKGAALRDVGKLARREIEEMLGRSVYLELWVSIKEKWRRNEALLKEFGYY